MKRVYKFYGKEDFDGRNITFDFPVPFEENLEADFKMQYGEALAFVKLIDHTNRVIRLHSAYDSGKGCKIIPPQKKERRKSLLSVINSNQRTKTNFIVHTRKDSWGIIFVRGIEKVYLFKEATFCNDGSIAGYNQGICSIKNIKKKIGKCLRYEFFESQEVK